MTSTDDAATPRGVDLARLALLTARAAAKRAEPSARRLPQQRGRRGTDGRDPVGLAAALRDLITDRAWERPAAAGGVLAEWPSLVPDLALHVEAIKLDAGTGQLQLRPESAAWGTQVRLQTSRIIAEISGRLGPGVVRSIRVLPPGPTQQEPVVAPSPAADPGPDRAAAVPQPALHRRPMRRAAPDELQQAIARQARAAVREPEDAFHPAAAQQPTEHRRHQDDVHRRARARARAERS